AGSELPNGDLVFTGAYEDTFPNGLPFINDPNVWLVRLSAEGCLVEGCNEWTIINPDGSITATEEPLAMNGGFIVYPNPGNGQVWVKAAGEPGTGQRCAMVLYDAQGRRMKAETFFAGRPQQFDWGDLQPGMYYYLIRTEDGAYQSGKLLIAR
ncbi:MAG: T9SS type A sorting domain-containing protein, partial [Saprospiraceae bacterium]|nr:T9SS type A sorting domain-containing protein [Saprospiraceae bacterium]